MSTLTTYYNLIKPSGAVGGDLVDVAQLNANADAIDAALHAHDGSITALQNRAAALEALNHYAMLSRAITQSIPNNAFTAVQFITEIADPDNVCPTPSTDITVKSTGVYQINIQSIFTSNATGNREARLLKVAGSVVLLDQLVVGMSGSGGNDYIDESQLVSLTLNDVLQVQLFQNSGGSLTCGCIFSMKRVA